MKTLRSGRQTQSEGHPISCHDVLEERVPQAAAAMSIALLQPPHSVTSQLTSTRKRKVYGASQKPAAHALSRWPPNGSKRSRSCAATGRTVHWHLGPSFSLYDRQDSPSVRCRVSRKIPSPNFCLLSITKQNPGFPNLAYWSACLLVCAIQGTGISS